MSGHKPASPSLPIPPTALSWCAAVLVAIATVVPAMLSAGSAAAKAGHAQAALAAARRDAAVVLPARAAAPSHAGQGLAEAAIAALTRAGIERSALEGLVPDATAEAHGPVVRRRATLTVRCTLPQLGRLLQAIPDLAPGWTASGVDLTPLEPARGAAPTLAPMPGPAPLRAVLTLEGVFAQEEPS